MDTEKTLKDIDTLLQRKQYRKISNILQDIIEIDIERHKSIQETIGFFNKLYDKLYYYIIFNKLLLDKKIVRQLESLAMPIQSKTEEEWVELFKNIRKEAK
jgi:hypothetical protein